MMGAGGLKPAEYRRGGTPLYNLLIGGAAGQGIDTAGSTLELYIKDSGCGVFTTRDLMSRIRGGHNFLRVRFGEEEVRAHSEALDGLVAFNAESAALHAAELKPEGFILCDASAAADDPRALPLDMAGIAKTLGNARVAGSVAVGAVLRLFGFPFDRERAAGVFGKLFKPELVDVNVRALEAGHRAVPERFPQPRGRLPERMLVSGNKALALGALAAGLQFYSAYPMSPSTSILEYLAQTAKETGILVEQAEDEIAAINMAIGASFAGGRAMTGTSGGGFSLMVEALGLSGMVEVPLVAVDVQRPGPATGLPTRTEQSDLLFVISAAQGEFPRMVIAPRHHLDAFHQAARAIAMAEKYQLPVILLSDQYLADATAAVVPPNPSAVRPSAPEAPKEGEPYARYRYTDSGVSPRIFPGDRRGFAAADSDEHDEWGRIIEDGETRNWMMEKRMRKLEALKGELEEPALLGDAEPEVLLVGWGSMFGPLEEAVRLLNQAGGTRYGALVFSDVWPLPQKELARLSKSAVAMYNVEQNYTGQLASLIRQETGLRMKGSVLRYDGRQMSGGEIARRVREAEQ